MYLCRKHRNYFRTLLMKGLNRFTAYDFSRFQMHIIILQDALFTAQKGFSVTLIICSQSHDGLGKITSLRFPRLRETETLR